MKQRRFRRSFRQSSSALHKVVGRALRFESGPFESHKIYQEYPVNKVDVTFGNPRSKFDWVVLDLKLVIECHGRQHYEEVPHFGVSLADQRYADICKKTAAKQAGFTYIVVPYYEQGEVTPEYLWDKYQESYNNTPPPRVAKKTESEYDIQRKEKARKYRKAQYQRLKRLKEDLNDLPSNRHTRHHT